MACRDRDDAMLLPHCLPIIQPHTHRRTHVHTHPDLHADHRRAHTVVAVWGVDDVAALRCMQRARRQAVDLDAAAAGMDCDGR
eukprot:357928-Chlamydomonas_euryale.AAC.3